MFNNRKQIIIFLILLGIYALSAFLTYAFFIEQLAAMAGMPIPDIGVSPTIVGIANAGIILVVYGFLGLFGIWFAGKLDLQGIYREDGNWKSWFWVPLLLGV